MGMGLHGEKRIGCACFVYGKNMADDTDPVVSEQDVIEHVEKYGVDLLPPFEVPMDFAALTQRLSVRHKLTDAEKVSRKI